MASLISWLDKKRKQVAGAAVDLVNPNTQADQQRRVAQGQPRLYKARQQYQPQLQKTQVRRDNQPGFQLGNNSLTRGVSRVVDQVNPYDNGRTYKQRTPTANLSVGQQQRQQIANNVKGTALRGVRTATGFGQAASGIVDLASPGLGTSRVSKGLDRFAKATDNKAKQWGVNASYQATALPMELLAGGGVGSLVKQGIKRSPQIIKTAAKVYDKGLQTASKFVAKDAGVVGKTTAYGMRKGLTPEALAADTVMSTKYIGEDASKGVKITPQRVATDIGLGVIAGTGAPIVGDLAKRGITKAAPGVVKASQNFQQARSGARNRQAEDAGAKAERRQLESEIRQIDGRLNALPPTPQNAQQVNALLIKRDTKQGQLKNIQGAQRTNMQKVTDRVLTANPGLTVGGPNALRYMQAKKAGQVFDGVDGKPRFEIDDSGAKVKPEAFAPYPGSPVQYARMGDLLDHPELYKNYPDLANVDVAATPGLSGMQNGRTRGTSDIEINPELLNNPDKLRSNLLHEGQHVIQNKEKFASGGSPSKDRPGEYYNLAGEAEARAVEKRADLPMSKRYVIDKSDTPDTKSLKREIAELDRKINAFDGDSPARQKLIDRQIRAVEELEGGKAPKTADDYAMSHRPREEGPRAFDLTEAKDEYGDNMIPKDMYEQWYGADKNSQWGRESIAALQAIKGNPDAKVTIYRAGPKDELNSGDWVSLSKSYAKQHAESNGNGYKVIAKEVPAKDVRWAMDDINEFGYFPPKQSAPSPTKRSTFYDSLDVPKDELIVRNGDGVAMSIDAGAAAKQGKVSPDAAVPPQPPAGTGKGSVSLPDDNPDFAKSKFPNRLKEDDRTAPLERTIEGNAYHDIKHNKDTLAETAKGIAENEDKALALAKRGTSTEANATSLQLLEKYLSEGNMEKADDLLQAVLPRFTRQGQQIQILAAYSKLSPAGAVKYAQQQLNKAVAKSGRGERIDVEVEQLHKAIQQTNDQASKQIEAELTAGTLGKTKQPKTPEQMLADRIKASSERKTNTPDPVKDMVNTLHKVAKEVLPEQGKNAPRDPMELIGAAIRDKKTYGDTYDQAKAIVMDKYKDNPEALAELDKYFSSDAARTYATGQLDKGIQTGLKGTDLGKLVREHYSKVDETGADLKAKLIKQAGLSEAEAGQLAGDIQKRFAELTGNKKQQILDSMFKTRNKPEQKDAVQKILELSNLGAFSKDELRGAVSLKLGAPTLSREATSTIAKMADDIQKMPEGADKNRKAAEMMQFIQKQVPSDMTDKVMGAWTAGLISGGKTITGAPVSNVTNALTRSTVSPIAAGLDFARTAGGTLAPRSNTVVSPTNYIRGFVKEGLPAAGKFLKTGIDERAPVGSDYPEINYNTKAVGKLVNGVFRLMGALDRPFYYGQKALSQAEMTKLERLNKGKQFNQKTPEELVEQDARISVLDFDTVLSRIGTAVKRATDNNDDAFSRVAGKVAAQLNAPFVRIPSAGLARMVDFSPMGAPLNIARQLANMKFGAQKGIDWRSLNTAIAESATGTGIGLVLGYKLAQNGLVTGEYPSSDPKEAKRWEAEQIQPNSVKINGTWVSMNYLGPFGSLLQQGRRFQESQADGDSLALAAGKSQGGVVRDALNQSYLQGLNSSLEAAKDPQRAMASKVNGLAGTLVPAAINDVSVATDKMQREAKTPFEAMINRTPFKQNLREKQDVYGNPLERKTGAIGSAINPLRPSDDKSQKNPVVAEVSRLKNSDPRNKDLQVTPTPVDKKLKIENQEVKLTDKQRYDLQKEVGQATQKEWGKLIKTDEYKALDDLGKAKALADLRSDVAGATQRQYVVNNNLATYSKEMTKKQAAVMDGDADLAAYAEPKSEDGDSKSSAKTDYAKEFKAAEKEFNKKSSTWSSVEKSKKQRELNALRVKKDYDKDTVALYGMGKQQVWDLLSTDKNGKAMADKLLAYGDALVNAGLSNQNPYRDSKGNTAWKPKEKGSGGSDKETIAATLAAAKATSGTNSLTKARTTNAPATKTAAASYRKPVLKQYRVSNPKISLKQLAKLGRA